MKINKTLRVSFAVLLFVFALTLFARAGPDDDQRRFPACRYCGMDRHKYASSRMLVKYSDGSEYGFCSIHCLAIDLAVNTDKMPDSIKASDYSGNVLIDAETAFWVIGGTIRGVMTERAKWAFAARPAAENFTRQNGGNIVSFEQALEAAYQDMYVDSKAIRNRIKIKKMIRGLETRSPVVIRKPSGSRGK